MPSITLTCSAQDWLRISNALGKLRGLTNPQTGAPRAATEAEFKQSLAGVVKGWVNQVEHENAVQAITIAPPDLT